MRRRRREDRAEKLYSADEALERINALLRPEAEASLNLASGEPSGVHIAGSHRIRSKSLRMEVCRILERTEGVLRTAGDLSAEWAGHNAVYRVYKVIPEIGNADLEFAGDKRFIIRFFTRIMDLLGIH